MKYLALIYGDEARWAGLWPEERDREMREYVAVAQEDVTVGGNELDATATATNVRVRDGETLVTDGPFVELKEALGGYYIFECGSIDEACRWAAKIPAARHGAVTAVGSAPWRARLDPGARLRRRARRAPERENGPSAGR
ncbi:MAG: YciI family protein [Actinobacteria bacterium]|nr:YciI family protein [Actinomycetota bacterium]